MKTNLLIGMIIALLISVMYIVTALVLPPELFYDLLMRISNTFENMQSVIVFIVIMWIIGRFLKFMVDLR